MNQAFWAFLGYFENFGWLLHRDTAITFIRLALYIGLESSSKVAFQIYGIFLQIEIKIKSKIIRPK